MIKIQTHWPTSPRPGNLGDVLTPVVLRAFGIEPVWSEARSADLLAIGSIVRFSQPGQHVWGSGVIDSSDRPHPRAKYHAVRGPLTRDIVLREGGECPPIYGDPALLLPFFHSRPVEKLHNVGLVPHYIDRDDPCVLSFNDGPVIDPIHANPLEVVDEIRSCELIMSSSLHGLIVANAYGIPAAWIKFGDRLTGDDIKFADYAASVGIDLLGPAREFKDAVFGLGMIDLGPLINALMEIKNAPRLHE